MLRPRFAAEVAARIEALAWWDWPQERLFEAVPDMQTLPIEAFLDRWGGRRAWHRAGRLRGLGHRVAETADAHRVAEAGAAMIFEKPFTRIANHVARAAGLPATFIDLLRGDRRGWAVTGPIFGFSDTWQLIINTGTTIVTFLMVFLIQNTQNRDGAAMQAKLDELIRVSKGA